MLVGAEAIAVRAQPPGKDTFNKFSNYNVYYGKYISVTRLEVPSDARLQQKKKISG